MAADGIEEVTARLERFIERTRFHATEQTLTLALIQAGAYAADMTPVDTGTLINSQGRDVQLTADGWEGVLYYGAEYAAAVHEASGVLKGEPRADFGVTRDGESFGGGTGVGSYWDPNGEPGFLDKGMERMYREDLRNIILGEYGV